MTPVYVAIIVLYASVTILDLVRGVIHTFFYKNGLNNISGLATKDALCDGRLAVLMIAYGGANLESFLVRSYILYNYAGYNHGLDYVRASSLVSGLWYPVTFLVSCSIEVGDAELPGRWVMLVRMIVSLVTLLLTFLYPQRHDPGWVGCPEQCAQTH